jgi:hypothetical protein
MLMRLKRDVTVSTHTGCWIWTAGRSEGYGVAWDAARRRSVRVHQLVYEMKVGPVPDGLVLDHQCRNTLCCNPEHLEAVTQGENVRRGESAGARAVRTNHCRNGHDLALYAGRRKDGTRYCQECNRSSARRSNARRAKKRA